MIVHGHCGLWYELHVRHSTLPPFQLDDLVKGELVRRAGGGHDQAGEIAAHELLGNTHEAHVHIDLPVVAPIAVIKPMTLGGGQRAPPGSYPRVYGTPKLAFWVVVAYSKRR